MARETWVQSQVESYQRLKKWYLMPPCLTFRYGSRVKWSNPWKRVAPSSTPWCSSYRKGSLRVTLNYGMGQQLYIYIYIYIYFAEFWKQLYSFKYSYLILIIFKQMYLLYWTLTGQCEPESNVNREVTQHFLKLQNWSLTSKCSLVSYLGYFFFFFFFLEGGGLTFLVWGGGLTFL